MADNSNVVAYIEQADGLVAASQWPEALELYRAALQLQPDDVSVRQHVLEKASQVGEYGEVIRQNMDLAELYVRRGEYDQARASYQAIIVLEQGAKSDDVAVNSVDVLGLVAQAKPVIYAKLGSIDLLEDKAQSAVEWLKASLQLDPSHWEIHMALGRAFMAAGRDKDAISEFQEVVRLAPSEAASAYEMLGEVFIRAGRPVQSNIMWFRNAGELFVQHGEMGNAIRAYERIIQFEPNNKDILLRLATIYADEQLNEKAAGVFEALAGVYEREGLTDKVIYFYERLLECNPEHRGACERLVAIYESILGNDPSNDSVRGRLADCLGRSGRVEEAAEQRLFLARVFFERNMLEEAYNAVCQILESLPDHIEARRFLGDIYKRREMNTEALTEYLNVVELYRKSGNEEAALELQHLLVGLFPEMTDLKYQVTLALRANGDHQGAIEELVRLLQDNPADMVARGYLAEEYAVTGRWDEAVGMYRFILESDPSRTDVRKRLIKHFLEVEELNDALLDIRCLSDDDVDKLGYFYRIVEICLAKGRYDDVERYIGMLPENDERLTGFRKELLAHYLESRDLQSAEKLLFFIPCGDKDRNRFVSSLMELYINAGNLEAVAGLVDRLPEDDVLRLSFRHRLITCYQDCGRFDEARVELDRLPANDELHDEFLSRQISFLMNAGKFEEAIAGIACLAQDSPARNSFMGQLVEAYLQSGDIDRAAQEVAKFGGGEFSAKYKRRLVQAYLNAQRLQEAEREIFALDAGDPEKNSFLRQLLQKYEVTGNVDRLRELALELPDDMIEKQQYLDGVARSYLASGDMMVARQEVYRMAESVAASGDHREAEHLYRTLLDWYPVDIDVRVRLCTELACQGKLERAREGMLVLAGRFHREGNITSAADIYSRLLDIDPQNLNARYRLGDIWADQGQSAQALEQFGFLADVYLTQNLPEVAQRVLNRILVLDPKDIVHRRQLIQLLSRNLRFDEATDHYTRLLDIYLERGELDEARGCVREIVQLQPLNLDLRQNLGEMFLNAGFLEEGQQLMEDLASTYKGRGDHANVVRVFSTLSRVFESNQQWETSLEYLERVADEQVEAGDWHHAHGNYVYALKMYLLRGRKENADPLFVRFVDGFFRHNDTAQGVKSLENLDAEFSEQGRLDLSMVVKDRLASIMERLSEWAKAFSLISSIAQVYLQLGDREQSSVYYRRAADLAFAHDMHQDGLELLFQLMSLTLECRGFEATSGLVAELRQRSDNAASAVERIGDIFFSHDLFDASLSLYNEVLELNPDSVGALSRLVVIYARDNDLEKVSSLSRRIVTTGLIGQVVSEYTNILGNEAGEAVLHVRLGEFYQRIGFLDEAICEYDMAIKEPAKVLVAVNHLAIAFSMKGYNGLAIRQLMKTLEQPGFDDEELLELRYNLAKILEQEGRFKEALQSYQECFAVDVGFRDVESRIDVLFEKVEGSGYSSNVYDYDEDLDGGDYDEGDYDEDI